MSADNWGKCPKCQELAENEKSPYGTVSEAEYLELIAKKKEARREPTLREDYEIWTDAEGFFYVSYSCHCSVCGFNFKYKHEQNLLAA